MFALVSKAAHDASARLDPDSACAKELSTIENAEQVVDEEIAKICQAATYAEITKILLLGKSLNKSSGREKEAIRNDLKKVADALLARVQAQSGPLRLPRGCLDLLFDL